MKTTEPKQTCGARVDDGLDPPGLRICGEPARVHVIDRTGETVDEYDCCSECAPWQEPMEGITVEPIEDVETTDDPVEVKR
jgi:hypothetical protein